LESILFYTVFSAQRTNHQPGQEILTMRSLAAGRTGRRQASGLFFRCRALKAKN
jgi:hypothetical protein